MVDLQRLIFRNMNILHVKPIKLTHAPLSLLSMSTLRLLTWITVMVKQA